MTPATQQLVVLNRLAELCRRRGSIRLSLREGAFGCADHLSPQRINFLTAAAPSAHGTGYALPSDCLGRVPVTPASDIQLGFGSDQRRGPVLTEFVQSAAQCGLVFVQENRHIAPGHFTQQAVARRASPANRSDQPDRAALPRGTNPRGVTSLTTRKRRPLSRRVPRHFRAAGCPSPFTGVRARPRRTAFAAPN